MDTPCLMYCWICCFRGVPSGMRAPLAAGQPLQSIPALLQLCSANEQYYQHLMVFKPHVTLCRIHPSAARAVGASFRPRPPDMKHCFPVVHSYAIVLRRTKVRTPSSTLELPHTYLLVLVLCSLLTCGRSFATGGTHEHKMITRKLQPGVCQFGKLGCGSNNEQQGQHADGSRGV